MCFVNRAAGRFFAAAFICMSVGLFVGCAELMPYVRSAGAGAAAGAGLAGKAASMERIDKAVAEGKISPEQGSEMKALVDALPNPEVPASPMENGVVYGIFFLLAKIAGDALKGFVRGKLEKKKLG